MSGGSVSSPTSACSSSRPASPDSASSVDVRDPVRELAGHLLLHAPRRVVALQPGRQDQQERRGLRVGEQPLEQLQRRRVGPVQVLEHDRHRAVLREPRDQLADDLERPILQRFGRELGETFRGVGLERQPQQRRQVRRDLGRASAEEPLDHPAERDADPQLRLVRERRRSRHAGGRGTASTASTRRTTRIGPRATAPGRAEGRRASNRSCSSASSRVLPIPGSPVTSRMPPVPARTPSTTSRPAASSRSRPISRACTPSRPRVRTVVPVAASADPRHDRSGLPLEIELRRRSPLEHGLDQPERLLPDEHGARLAERLQPGRRVHRIAERGVLDAAPRADRADDDRPRLDADADAEPRHAPGAPRPRARSRRSRPRSAATRAPRARGRPRARSERRTARARRRPRGP